jgi:hypothetical protein
MAQSRINGTIDYVEEATYGTTPANPALSWIGTVYSAKPVVKIKTDSKRFLPSAQNTTTMAYNWRHTKVGTDIGLEIGYVPQTGTFSNFLKYFVGNKGTALGGDTMTPISVALQHANLPAPTGWITTQLPWHVFKGCVGTDFTFNAPEDGVIDCKGTFACQELAAPSATDPAGSGSHPAASTAAELTIDDISACQMKYSASGALANCTDAINALSFKISNKIGFSKDIANSTSTRIAGYALNSRTITLDLDLDYFALENATPTGMSITDVRSLTAFDFAFTLDGKTYTFKGLKFPELPYEFGPDDLLGDKVTSLAATDFTIV